MQNSDKIWQLVDTRREAYEALSDRVWEIPEIAYTEYRSVAEHRRMLDEEGFSRESAVNALNQQGRRTNWDVVSELMSLTREQHLAECRAILQEACSLPGELGQYELLTEGAVCQVLVNRYEREPLARQRWIAHYGATCVVCGFNFGAVYGYLRQNPM